MVAYRRQHFLPCCYLKFFSIDGTWAKVRSTRVYFTDGAVSGCASVNDLGVESYTYSKQNPEFDKQFNNMEKDYSDIVEMFLNGPEKMHKTHYFRFITMMIDFNLRSVAYENLSEVERMHTYQTISRSFMHDLFFEAPGQGTDLPEMRKWMEQNWRIQPVLSETSEKFITSDNPSTIYTEPKDSRPVMFYLPVHPKLAVIAYDKRHLTVTSNRVTDDALGVLNGLQIYRSVRHTFADHDLEKDPDDWPKIQKLANREKPERWVNGNEWKPDFISIASPSFDRFSFMERV